MSASATQNGHNKEFVS